MDEREKIMDKKCRRCGLSYINGGVFCCDYLSIMGHSRGCSIEECTYYKDHPRAPGDTKARACGTRAKAGKTKRKKANDADVLALTAAILGKYE